MAEKQFVRNIVEDKCDSCHGNGTKPVTNAQGEQQIETCRSCGGTGKSPVKQGK